MFRAHPQEARRTWGARVKCHTWSLGLMTEEQDFKEQGGFPSFGGLNENCSGTGMLDSQLLELFGKD